MSEIQNVEEMQHVFRGLHEFEGHTATFQSDEHPACYTVVNGT